ncbi:MAG: hypothetical protein GY700_06425 [Propionibacteriaceae bacterium]|nr:hypothetical protein [Propionibacteriaceae bacterium]
MKKLGLVLVIAAAAMTLALASLTFKACVAAGDAETKTGDPPSFVITTDDASSGLVQVTNEAIDSDFFFLDPVPNEEVFSVASDGTVICEGKVIGQCRAVVALLPEAPEPRDVDPTLDISWEMTHQELR